MPHKMFQPTKMIPGPDEDKGDGLLESCMTDSKNCMIYVNHHCKQAVGIIDQSLISTKDSSISDNPSYTPLEVKASMFDGHVSKQDVHSAMLKKYTWTTDDDGNIDPDGKAPQVHTDTEKWSREQLMARWVHALITEPTLHSNKAKKSVILSFYSEAFKLPASLPETGSDAAKKLWADVAKHFVCAADTVFEFGDVFDPKNPNHRTANIAMMTGFSYENDMFIHDANATNHQGPLDKRELFYAPKFVCDYVYDLAVKLLGEQNVPAVVAYCTKPDYTPDSLDFVRKSRQDTKRYVDSNPVPGKKATPEQWERWVQNYNQAVVYTVPMIGPADNTQMDNFVAKLICPENDIGRAQYELTICKGSNVDAKGSGFTLPQFRKLMTTHVYRTLESKYKNNTVLVVGSAGGSGKGAGGGRGGAGSGALGKRRDRGASDDAAAAGTAGARRARVTMVDLKASIDTMAQNLAQNQAQLTVPPGMVLLSSEQWESLRATVEKATSSVESLQTELSEQKKAAEEQTSRSDKMMAALEKVVNAKAAAVTVNVHKGAPPVEKAVGGAGGAGGAATEANSASATPVTGVTKGAKKKLPEKSLPADPKIRDEDSDDDDDEEESESSESESECSSDSDDSDDEKDDDEDEDEKDEEEKGGEEKDEEEKGGEEGGEDGDVSMSEAAEVAEAPMETQAETQDSSEAPEAQMAEGGGEDGEDGEDGEGAEGAEEIN